MEKDTVYSMRMSSRMREALKRAAKKESRTMASLLDKIIGDYLRKEGFLLRPELGEERRHSPRKKITLPARTFLETGSNEQAFQGVILDISKGGMLLTYAKGTDIQFISRGALPSLKVCFNVPRNRKELCFDCTARHMRDAGDEIHVGASFDNPTEKDLERLSPYVM